MIHNLRTSERLPLSGKVELLSGGSRVCGRLVDISLGGIAIAIAPEMQPSIAARHIWLCRIESNDLPASAAFLVKVLREKTHGYKVELGCRIASISEKSLAFVRAYRALARARDKRLARAA